MKRNKVLQILGLGLVLTIAAGCKHHPAGITPLPHGPGSGTVGGNEAPGSGLTPGSENPGASSSDIGTTGISEERTHNGWNKNPDMFKADTVHFAYDSTVIRSGDKSKIDSVADYLKNNPSAAVEVDGHCDERGTDEYNRALGERRALAVREALVTDGIEANRVETVSFGRDRPVDTGHSEAAHARNRRGEFILLTPPNSQ